MLRTVSPSRGARTPDPPRVCSSTGTRAPAGLIFSRHRTDGLNRSPRVRAPPWPSPPIVSFCLESTPTFDVVPYLCALGLKSAKITGPDADSRDSGPSSPANTGGAGPDFLTIRAYSAGGERGVPRLSRMGRPDRLECPWGTLGQKLALEGIGSARRISSGDRMVAPRRCLEKFRGSGAARCFRLRSTFAGSGPEPRLGRHPRTQCRDRPKTLTHRAATGQKPLHTVP